MYNVDMKKIPLTRGKYAIVDDEDYVYLSQFSWHDGGRYAIRHTSRKDGHRPVWMHREIIGVSKGKHVDHINGDCYDNRRTNLRLATSSQNNQNAKIRKDNTTGYKGVCYRAKSRDYVAYININGKRIHLKTYRNLEDAIVARKTAELKYHGAFAYQRRV